MPKSKAKGCSLASAYKNSEVGIFQPEKVRVMELPETMKPVIVMSLSDRMAAVQHDEKAKEGLNQDVPDRDAHSVTTATAAAPLDSSHQHRAKAAKTTKSTKKGKTSSKAHKTKKENELLECTKDDLASSAMQTCKRKLNVKPRATRKRKDQEDVQPKPSRSRKKAVSLSPSGEATVSEDAAALSATLSSWLGSDSGMKSSSSSQSCTRSKVRYSVSKKGRSHQLT